MSFHPVTSWLGVAAYLAILGLAGAAFAYAIRLRLQQVTQGRRPEVRWDQVPQRIKNVFIYVLGQNRLPRNGYLYSGILHIFIFGAFVVLSVDTVNFIIDGLLRSVDVATGAPPGGPFHLPFSGRDSYYQALADTFRFLCIFGLGMAFFNRLVLKPKRLPLTRDALYTLYFILALMVFEVTQIGFGLARAADGGELPAGTGHIWLSSMFARLVGGLGPDALEVGFQASWWLHLVTLLGFSNYVPYSKHSHVFAAPFNIFFMSLEPKGAIRKMNIDLEDEEVEYFGARNLEDLSWKQVFDGLACTECGRCTDNCPASMSGKPLKPMDIIVQIKHHAEDRLRDRGQPIDLAEDARAVLTKGVIDPDVLWSCTTCRACMEVCPVGNEHIPMIIDMRRYLTMGLGEVGHGAQTALKKMDSRGNPWGMPKRQRDAWAEGCDVPRWDAEKPAEYLYWVGCAGAYDDRAQKVTKSVARLMKKAGVDYAILGNDESCTGDSARRLGDEFLFQTMAQGNVETLNASGVKKIVTHCPHCFNTLKNEYPQFGGNYEVIHHSELLSKLVREGKLKPQGEAAGRIVYHDSCYLGRYNDIYDPQRDIIDALPGVERVESERHHGRGLCCGAGGGQMWMELNIGTRMNFVRTNELLETKPDVIAVACNFCMTMVDDGVKAKGREDAVQVLDLAELLDRSITD